MTDPLIATLRLDEANATRFDRLRRRHFPPERNRIPAHVTLFNQLPGDREDRVRARLRDVAALTPVLPFTATEVMALSNRGAAYRLDVPGFDALRNRIGAGFDLIPQDRGRRRPHVTVQNKVDPETAAATLAELRDGFAPFTGRAMGLDLWYYRGGPWERCATHAFAGYRLQSPDICCCCC
ncbi:2'-5' RNA ligase family protein [Jannaschia sp. LMIT008]|uniref:2'-5' RNA ligase family protein n=1 Tax=Jannaschia maritima TaxID=3032585 RepID=UPI002810D02D|nr:2'-5' RNA ligase family protein [Jannaschia sp. LMIT008]